MDGKLVYTIDPKTVLHALDAETGEEVWRKNLVREYGSKIPPWYNGQNPLIEDDKVLVAPVGASALVVALDKATGKEIWTTPNPEGWLLSHASLMPATLGGVDQYLFSVLQGTVGVAAADGKRLWHFPFKFNLSVSPSPLVISQAAPPPPTSTTIAAAAATKLVELGPHLLDEVGPSPPDIAAADEEQEPSVRGDEGP